MERKIILLAAALLTLVNLVSAAWVTPGYNVSDPNKYTVHASGDWAFLGDAYHWKEQLSNPYFNHTIYLKQKSSDTILHPLAIVRGDYIITQSPQDMDLGGTNIGKKASGDVVVDVSTQTATYPAQYGSGMDLKYKYGLNYIKETLVINSISLLPASTADSYLNFKNKIRAYNTVNGGSADVTYNRMKLREGNVIANTNGAVDIVDSKGIAIYSMMRPYAYDSSGNATELNFTLTVSSFGNVVVEFLVPYSWLATATYPVYIDPSWTTPSSVISYSSSNGANVYKVIDGNLDTYWDEDTLNDHDNGGTEWDVTLDMSTTYVVENMRISRTAGVGGVRYPCKVMNLYVCDDTACSGESDLLSSDCQITSANTWVECDFADTIGRYVKVMGGILRSSDSTCVDASSGSMNGVNEIQFYVDDTTTTTTTTLLPSRLELNWVNPTINSNHTYQELKTYIIRTCCRDSTCGNVNVTLDPVWSWWNATFKNKRNISISPSRATIDAGRGYVIGMTMNSTSPADYTWKYRCNDIRFMSSSQSSELPYYIQYCNNVTKMARIWFKLLEAAPINTNLTIWMYYNASGMVNKSNGRSTFKVFDDFNGATLNTSLWTQGRIYMLSANAAGRVAQKQLWFNGTGGGYVYWGAMSSISINPTLLKINGTTGWALNADVRANTSGTEWRQQASPMLYVAGVKYPGLNESGIAATAYTEYGYAEALVWNGTTKTGNAMAKGRDGSAIKRQLAQLPKAVQNTHNASWAHTEVRWNTSDAIFVQYNETFPYQPVKVFSKNTPYYNTSRTASGGIVLNPKLWWKNNSASITVRLQCNPRYSNTKEDCKFDNVFLRPYDEGVRVTLGTKFNNVKSGIVPHNPGMPFYTASPNPSNISLALNECKNVNWYVNATGPIGGVYTVFGFANITSKMTTANVTSDILITIVALPEAAQCGFDDDSDWVYDDGVECVMNTDQTKVSGNAYIRGAGSTIIIDNAIIKFQEAAKWIIDSGGKLVLRNGGKVCGGSSCG